MSSQSFQDKIATPYAEALIDYAQSKNSLDQATNELSSVLSVLSESSDLKKLLLNPLCNIDIKKDVLKRLFQNQVQDFILNFLLVLVDRRRISFLETVIKKYLDLTYIIDSVTIVELYSVIDIDDKQQSDLIDKVKSMTNTSTVKLILNKEPDLIGGFIIKIGSKVIDSSLLGKLKSMSLYLNTN